MKDNIMATIIACVIALLVGFGLSIGAHACTNLREINSRAELLAAQGKADTAKAEAAATLQRMAADAEARAKQATDAAALRLAFVRSCRMTPTEAEAAVPLQPTGTAAEDPAAHK